MGIFLLTAVVSGLLVIACFMSQSDVRIRSVSQKHIVGLYTLIIATWGIPEVLLLLGTWVITPHTHTGLGYAIVFLQFVLLAVVYAMYRLTGVLALHCAGLMMYLMYLVLCTIGNLASFGELPAVSADTGLFFGLAAAAGSLVSVVYALVYITMRRRRGRAQAIQQ